MKMGQPNRANTIRLPVVDDDLVPFAVQDVVVVKGGPHHERFVLSAVRSKLNLIKVLEFEQQLTFAAVGSKSCRIAGVLALNVERDAVGRAWPGPTRDRYAAEDATQR